MKVFFAGASGVIGRRLLPILVEAGHEVTATTRSPEKTGQLAAAGAAPVVVDALDADALAGAVRAAEPEVVVNQLTNLPRRFNPRKPGYGDTARLRSEGTRTLAEAAKEVGARRLISQSICFIYAPVGSAVKDEGAPLLEPTTGTAFDEPIRGTVKLEQITTQTPGIEGVVLRYGWFYGPGTYFAREGAFGLNAAKRRFPIVGDGGGISSFVHVDDAAGATVVALDRGEPGIYNVCDDDPAMMREWLPAYARALGAKPPWRIPALIARLVAGRMAVAQATELRGASNAKAKRELGWTPRYPSWRQGLPESLSA